MLFCTILQETVIRQTEYGLIEGFSVDLVPSNKSDNRVLDVFVGIPYAQVMWPMLSSF